MDCQQKPRSPPPSALSNDINTERHDVDVQPNSRDEIFVALPDMAQTGYASPSSGVVQGYQTESRRWVEHMHSQLQPTMQYHGNDEDGDTASTSQERPHTRITRRAAKDARSHEKSKQVLAGRIEKASKRRSTAKATKMEVNISEPFSQSIQRDDHSRIESVDIERYVNRSTEERLGELRDSRRNNKGDGDKIKRPCNAFMLYRKTYQNVVKTLYKHENHQWISKACGFSWGMETHEVKNRFAGLARIERENHSRAFPGYKFSPARSKNSAKKKGDDLSDCGSTLDPQDWAEATTSNGSYPARHHLGMHHNSNSSSPPQVDFGAVPVAAMPGYSSWGHSQGRASHEEYWSPMPDDTFARDPLMGQTMPPHDLALGPYDVLPNYNSLPPSMYPSMGLDPSGYTSIDPKLMVEAGENVYGATGFASQRDWASQIDLSMGAPLEGVDIGNGLTGAVIGFDAENDSHGSYLRGDGDWNVASVGDEGAQFDPVWSQSHS